MDIKLENEMCERYSAGAGLEELCKVYHLGKLKIKDILQSHGVEIRKRGGVQMNEVYRVSDYHIEKYPLKDGYHYIAVDRNNGITYNDYNNSGGFLTSHIKKEYGVEIPTLYDRRKYYMRTGDYWWEQWFDIKLVKDQIVKKCPYCDWTTTDLENKSGMFLTHLKTKHGLTCDQYLVEHPEDTTYFSKQAALIEKKELLKKEENYVVCPICGEKLEKITWQHIMFKHNMDYQTFKEKYPDVKVLSDNMLEQTRKAQPLSNLSVGKHRFVSSYERELQAYLKSNGIEFAANRQILIGKEIDILIEDKKIGIEFDGLKFHTEWFGNKPHNYHLNKTIECAKKGYGLIHIFEDEYVKHKDIVYSKIRHILHINDNNVIRIGGRQCVIREIKKHEAEIFLNKYHIQGFSSASIYIGAYYGDVLVAVMLFKKGNIRNPSWELTRFATDYNYICAGIGGKLFAYFVKTYNPSEIVSFADRRWTVDYSNNLYTKLGFKFDRMTPPDYTYYNERVDRYKRIHKLYFNKKKLSRKYSFPMTMTETEMAKELGYDRIWNCGLIRYVWRKEK